MSNYVKKCKKIAKIFLIYYAYQELLYLDRYSNKTIVYLKFKSPISGLLK